LKEIRCDNALKTVTLDFSDHRKLAVGDFKGYISCFDIETSKCIFQTKVHDGMINKIDGAGSQNGPFELCTASRDGTFKIFDIRQNATTIFSHKSTGDCWAVSFGRSFSDTERSLAVGYKNGDFKNLDMRNMQFIQEMNIGHGICHLEWKEKYLTDESIMASCMDGKLFEIANKEVKSIETGGTSTLWCVSRYEDHMAVGDGAGSLSIFKNNRKMETALVSKKPLIAIDWNHEIPGLILTTSFEKHINILLLQHLK
jgi:WD40 repeat protein